ncbi:LytTR family DNA-binding domain-containing protein [Roseobacter sp. A03A-229]
MNDTVRATLHHARDLGGRSRFWAGLVGVAAILGLIGPFGTYDALPLAPRLAYWFAICVLSFWVGYLTSACVATGAGTLGLAAPLAVGLGGLAASLPVVAMVSALDLLVFGAGIFRRGAELLPVVAIISVVIALLFEALDMRDLTPPSKADPMTAPAWLDQLPASVGRDLIALHAQDHYLAARTSQGETLLRASLSEATTELGAYGLRVHRSWWVARHWVLRIETRKGQSSILLRDGTRVPVGRVYRAAVRGRLQQP